VLLKDNYSVSLGGQLTSDMTAGWTGADDDGIAEFPVHGLCWLMVAQITPWQEVFPAPLQTVETMRTSCIAAGCKPTFRGLY
jgi:hypothetical protein